MQYYFFTSPGKENAATFRQYAIKQNVATANILSVTIMGICLLLFTIKFFFDYGNIVSNTREYRDVLIFLLCCSIIYRFLVVATKKLVTKKRLTAYWILSSYYALVIACGFMWLTFIAQHNPGNTMTMFMAGMFGVAILWILDLLGTVSISLITLTVFFISLHNFQGNHLVLWQNYITASTVLVLFFVISRILYSYHFRYYLQLKTIEEKNREIVKIYQKQTDTLDMVAHDMRSPLNSIMALISLAQLPSSTEEERAEYYNLILLTCKDAEHTLHDMINAAKQKEAGIVEKEIIPVNEFLKAVKEQWDYRMPAKRKLLLDYPEVDILAPINKQKMQRVLDNLISNAIKFTDEDGIINISLKNENEKFRISVSDNGIGIPPDLQPYIFDRFTKAGRTGLYGEKSYGLGLNICEQIVKEHNGTIILSSIEKKGTTFHIDIPLYNN